MRINRIHHLTLAVRDLEGARMTFAHLFGVTPGATRAVDAFDVRAADVALGDAMLQLVAPKSTDNPVQRFLERKGEGLYTVALEVDDLDLAVAELASQGVRVSKPVTADDGVRSAFVTMAAAHGLSIQLVEAPAAGDNTQPSVAAVTILDEPRAEHLPEHEPPPGAQPPRQIDLTPDEWSDTD